MAPYRMCSVRFSYGRFCSFSEVNRILRGNRFFPARGESLVCNACPRAGEHVGTTYYSAPSALVRLALFLRSLGHAVVVGFRWAFPGNISQYVYREMLITPEDGLYLGCLGGDKFPIGAAALRPKGGEKTCTLCVSPKHWGFLGMPPTPF